MERLIEQIQDELNKFAERFPDSEIVDSVIALKKRIPAFISRKTQQITSFYRSSSSDPITFKLREAYVSIRIVFYKASKVGVYICHRFESSCTIKDSYMMEYYCIDSGIVYFIKSDYGWKIGKTKNIRQRMRTFKVKLPFKFDFVFYVRTAHKSKLEIELHNHFKDFRIDGEWFNITETQIRDYFKDNSHTLSQTISGRGCHERVD